MTIAVVSLRRLLCVTACAWLCASEGAHTGVTLVAQQQEVELTGVVATVRGVCPTVTFSVNGTAISTTEETQFDGLSCADLQDGAPVEVEGAPQPSGPMVATEIEANHEGEVEGLRGVCPDLVFQIEGTAVSTDRDTDFEGIRCDELANGVRVEVEGNRLPNGGLLAGEVEPADEVDEGDDNDDDQGDDR